MPILDQIPTVPFVPAPTHIPLDLWVYVFLYVSYRVTAIVCRKDRR